MCQRLVSRFSSLCALRNSSKYAVIPFAFGATACTFWVQPTYYLWQNVQFRLVHMQRNATCEGIAEFQRSAGVVTRSELLLRLGMQE